MVTGREEAELGFRAGLCDFRAVVSNVGGWGSFDNVCRHFWFTPGREWGCHLLGRDMGCFSASSNAQDSPHDEELSGPECR